MCPYGPTELHRVFSELVLDCTEAETWMVGEEAHCAEKLGLRYQR
jgi:hypothetical protein